MGFPSSQAQLAPRTFSDVTGAGLPAVDAFNGALAAATICAATEMGVLDRLSDGEPVSDAALVEETGARPDLLGEVLRALAVLGYVEGPASGRVLTDAGSEAAAARGFFVWLIGGYGRLLPDLGDIVAGRSEYAAQRHRDPGRVAAGAGLCGEFMTPVIDEVLDGLEFRCFVDLGCGDGQRLEAVARRYPGTLGLGIDISEAACERARERLGRAGLGERVEIVCADVLDPAGMRAVSDRAGEADLVGCFLMLHDLFDRTDPPADALRALQASFPATRRFVVADTVRSPERPPGSPVPMFSLGFELFHAVMAVTTRPREEYEALFAEAGLSVLERRALGVPHTWLYVLGAQEDR